MTSSTSTSLTLRALLKTAAGRLGLGVSGQGVSGLTAAAKALFAAAAAVRDRAVLVVPTDADVEQLTSDSRFFLSALEGISDADAANLVVPFPSHEIDPYRGLSPHFDIASARARTIHALSTGTARLVIASAAAALTRTSPRARFRAAGCTWRSGDELSPIDLGDRLAEAGSPRQDPTDEPGEFSVRGGVVDFYAAGARHPVRLEFVGDTIESLRTYDPGTQRSIEPIDQAHIVPLQELLTEVAQDFSPADAEETPDRSATFVDYLAGAQATLLVAEPDEIRAAIVRQREQIELSYAEAIRKNQRATEPAELVIGWDDLESTLAEATAIETLALGTEEAVRHIASQPAMGFSGRIPDWVAELRTARQAGETVVFVAHSQGRAERVVEMLADYQVPAAPIERGEDAHANAVLVPALPLSKGFRLPPPGLHLCPETDVFDEERQTHEKRRSATRTFLSDFRDLKVGDLIVHVDNGIGVFVGLKKIEVGLESQEFMELRYAGE